MRVEETLNEILEAKTDKEMTAYSKRLSILAAHDTAIIRQARMDEIERSRQAQINSTSQAYPFKFMLGYYSGREKELSKEGNAGQAIPCLHSSSTIRDLVKPPVPKPSEEKCSNCRGSGVEYDGETIECRECGGTGVVIKTEEEETEEGLELPQETQPIRHLKSLSNPPNSGEAAPAQSTMDKEIGKAVEKIRKRCISWGYEEFDDDRAREIVLYHFKELLRSRAEANKQSDERRG